MKEKNKTFAKCLTTFVTTAALAFQSICPSDMAHAVFAAGTDAGQAIAEPEISSNNTDSNNRIEPLLTSYTPQVIEFTDPCSGFTHPGVGVTKELLENLQAQVRQGVEPWKSYFETMLLDSWYSADNVGPARNGGGFNNSQFISDGSRAYAQAVMYFITGSNAYRRNAMNIIRAYENIDPESLVYFNDACIHTGIPTNRICIAAEILRYSTYEVTDGYTDAELAWTEEDTEKFISNFLSPEVEVFQYSPDRFMNQHLYTTIGAMSAYLFMDDAESYEKAVEWFTVNKNARDQGFNGAIKRLFREITTIDAVGAKEGSGAPLPEPVIQHVEMGRDQAHGCGDLTNSAILSRLMQSQNTKVDPVDGTVSTASDAVDCFTFLNNRLVNAADFFFEYMLGYDAEWVPVPFAIASDGTIKDSYANFAAGYRGRYNTINFWDFYTYYAYHQGMSKEEIQSQYPYFYEGYTKKTYTAWDNPDGGGDFWIFLPPEAAGDTSFIPAAAPANVIPVENRGALVTAGSNSSVKTDADGNTYFHFEKYDGESRVAMNTAGIGSDVFLFRVRTNGIARLTMSGGESKAIYLPDTGGEWAYATYSRTNGEGTGDLYYFSISQIEGSYVDVDAIYTNPAASGLDAVKFESGQEEISLVTYIGASFQTTLTAFNSTTEGNAVSYSGIQLPDGASVDAGSGLVSWSPQASGQYTFYISAAAGETIALKRININVSSSRAEAVEEAIRSYEETAVYTSATLKAFQGTLAEAKSMAADASISDAEFTAKLNELSDAAARLELVSPLLKNDPLTDGTSLDFSRMNVGNRSTFDSPAPWLDAEAGTFVGYWLVEDKGCIMDFGIDYKIAVNKFGFQARAGFSDRLAGVQVFGSNDRITWDKLTVAEAAYQQGYQTVDVAQEYHDQQYRFLMIKKTHEYADVLSGSVQNLLEFGELRIWGTRYETGNLIESIRISCDAEENGRIKMGDTVTLTIQGRDTLHGLKVNIHGVDAVITEGADNQYIASAVMNSTDCKAGAVSFTLNYTKADGTAGEAFYATTDNSSLFLVNSDILINTGMLAAELTASSGSWDGKLDPNQCAALLFDGNFNTFGDLKNQFGDYYAVDFGEGITVSLTDVMLLPRESHPARLNGTIIYGSNDTVHESYDEKEWTQLTPAVSGAAARQWAHFAESALLNKEAYRFFKILGAENGDISEVEFYGSYHAAVEKIAGQIGSMPVQEAAQSILVYPAVPAGFTLSVCTSSNEAVIGTDGSVCAAVEDTIVTLTLLITSATGETATTGEIAVTVRGLNSMITGISSPAKGAAALAMPGVPEGFQLTVIASDNEAVVALGEGRITMPEKDTLVKIKLKLLRESDGVAVESNEYTVLIYGQEESPELEVMALAASMAASSGSWDGRLNSAECAQQLFDKNESTFGDLKSGNTYTIDFGEGVAVQPSKFRFLPRAGGKNNTEYLPRMNGAYVEGSMDGQEWVQITAPLEGVTEFIYYEVTAEKFRNCGSFRYLRITGASSGNISEAEIYGIIDADIAAIASGITSLPDVLPGESSVTLPKLPAGITSTISSSSNTDIIALNGNVTLPTVDTDITVKLMLALNGKTAETAEITVCVKGISLKPIQPASDAIVLALPEMPDGFRAVISSTSHPDIIALNGTITKPHNASMVDVTVQLMDSRNHILKEETFSVFINGIAESPEIDVMGLAASMTASSDSWANVSRVESAQRLFDGNESTYGDLKDSNGFYIIDFGSSISVLPTRFSFYPRADGKNGGVEYLPRMNGTYVEASMDGNEWTTITAPLEGIQQIAEDIKYHDITADAFQDYGYYRYFRICGINGGNIAEVKFYGMVQADVNILAASITSLPAVSFGETSLTLPKVPAGYTVQITSSSNPDIIALDGTVTMPAADTEVILKLTVTGPNNDTAETADIKVLIKGIPLYVEQPADDDTSLNLPSAPEGFQVTISSTSNTDIIALNGNISRPQNISVVTVTLQLTDAKGNILREESFEIIINGLSDIPEITEIKNLAANMTASSGSYDGRLNEAQCAERLFDNDLSTFGDLKTGNTYTIDFGENLLIPVKFSVYPRDGKYSNKSSAEYINRLNGLKFQASNDGANWVDITAELEGITNTEDALKWYELSVTNKGIYRYLQITGSASGNIAEVKIYGIINNNNFSSFAIYPDATEAEDEAEIPALPSAPEEIISETKEDEAGKEEPMPDLNEEAVDDGSDIDPGIPQE